MCVAWQASRHGGVCNCSDGKQGIQRSGGAGWQGATRHHQHPTYPSVRKVFTAQSIEPVYRGVWPFRIPVVSLPVAASTLPPSTDILTLTTSKGLASAEPTAPVDAPAKIFTPSEIGASGSPVAQRPKVARTLGYAPIRMPE